MTNLAPVIRVPSHRAETAPTRVAVAGATGYAGAELVSILARHPHVDLGPLFSSGGRAPVGPAHAQRVAEPWSVDALATSGATVVFLATPNEVSAEIVPQILALGMRLIDLSGAFRLPEPSLYPAWYGFRHEHPSLLSEAVYGLTEWCSEDALAAARLVANPGCYPTSILLALRPLTFVIDRAQPVICDSKSGVSGAGKKTDLSWSFAEMSGNFKAYGVGRHRHEPEIRQRLHLGERATLVFVPHLLPTVRGILSTIHVGFSHPLTADELSSMYSEAYARAPFVRVLPAGALPELRDVVNTPFAEIGFTLLQGGRRAVIVSVIDNLLKGAASQAVQNFNHMCGYAETEGLA